ncbi:hypothetical protein ACJJTC_017322 [Scirpophaga incertulas]
MLEMPCCSKFSDKCVTRKCNVCKNRTIPYKEFKNEEEIEYHEWARDKKKSVNMNMQVALDALTELKKFLLKIRTDINFEEIVSDAKKIAEKLDVETEFETSSSRPLRCRKTPKSFDYEHEDHTVNDPKTSFKINVFCYILDQGWATGGPRAACGP